LIGETLAALISQLAREHGREPLLIKRRCPRWPYRAPADLYYRTPEGATRRIAATSWDISELGLGLICREQIPSRQVADVVIEIDGEPYHAKVRIAHCTQSVSGYRVGCEFLLPETPSARPPEYSMVGQSRPLSEERSTPDNSPGDPA